MKKPIVLLFAAALLAPGGVASADTPPSEPEIAQADMTSENPSGQVRASEDSVWDPAEAHVWAGSTTEYTPLMRYEPGGTLLEARFLLAGRGEQVSQFELDRDGTLSDNPSAFNGMVRAGAVFDSRTAWGVFGMAIEYEHDLFTGTFTDLTTVEGEAMPYTDDVEQQLRKANLRLSVLPWFHVKGGYMLNTWGMGLLANAGDQLWTPGSARFIDQRGGDRVLRAALAVGPFFDWKLRFAAAYDIPQEDNSLIGGDDAWQVVGSITAGDETTQASGGVFVVHRQQDNSADRGFDITAIDLAGKARFGLGKQRSVTIEGEMAFVFGDSTLSPSTDNPDKDVLQFGAAARANFDLGGFGTVIDFLYASGDPSYDDGELNQFRANRNYEFGILLFRHVMAGQTGRAEVTASDPELLGVPPDDLDRLATRGSPSNTIAFFPRAWVRPVDGLEIFGGPLIALSAVPYSDPLNTRLNGGTARGPRNGSASQFLGVEVDLGMRYRALLGGTELTFGLEGGVLIPGEAFNDAGGNGMDPVYGGRTTLMYRL